jgi:hypothetical protein
MVLCISFELPEKINDEFQIFLDLEIVLTLALLPLADILQVHVVH